MQQGYRRKTKQSRGKKDMVRVQIYGEVLNENIHIKNKSQQKGDNLPFLVQVF